MNTKTQGRGDIQTKAIGEAISASLRDGEKVRAPYLHEAIESVSGRGAETWARRFEVEAGRELRHEEQEEIGAIYHCEAVRAFAACGVVPASRLSLWGYAAPKRGAQGEARRDLLPFRVLLAWRRAMRRAANQSRSYLWGKGAEQLAFVGGVGADASATAIAESGALSRGLGDGARVQRGAMLWARSCGAGTVAPREAWRRVLAHTRDCLVIFWRMASGKGGGASRKWASGLREDVEFLDACAATARGRGLEHWSAEFLGDGRRASKAASDRQRRFLERVAKGDAVMAANPVAASVVLEDKRAALASLPVARRARVAGLGARKLATVAPLSLQAQRLARREARRKTAQASWDARKLRRALVAEIATLPAIADRRGLACEPLTLQEVRLAKRALRRAKAQGRWDARKRQRAAKAVKVATVVPVVPACYAHIQATEHALASHVAAFGARTGKRLSREFRQLLAVRAALA